MAMENVYEGSKLKVKVKLTSSSKKDTEKGELIITKDNVAEAPVSIDIKKQWAEVTHTFAKVADDKESYLIQFKVKSATETVDLPNDYTVWPKNSVVTVKDDKGATLPSTAFKLVFGNGKKQDHESDKTGKVDCSLKHKATFTLAIGPRFEVIAPPPAVGRARTLTVKPITYTAAFEAPDWPDQAQNHFVNRKSEEKGTTVGHDHQGTTLGVQLKGVPRISGAKMVDLVQSGDKYFIKLTLDALTKRTAKRASLEGVKNLKTSDDGKTITGDVNVGAGGKAGFKVKLGLGGLETCKLEVGTTDACADASYTFTGRRQMYFQQIGPSWKTVPTDVAKASLAKVGIDLILEPKVAFDLPSLPAGTVHSGKYFGLTQNKVTIIGDHNVKAMLKLFQNLHEPVSFFAMMADFQIDAADRRKVTKSTTLKKTNKVKFPGAGKVVGHTFTICGDDDLFLYQSLHHLGPSFQLTWRSLAASGTHAGKSGIILGEDVSFDFVKKLNQLTVRLPADALAVTTANEEVFLQVEAELGSEMFNGWSPNKTPGVVVALGNPDPRSDDGINGTFVHEIGHMINQVDDTAPAGLDRDADHGWHFRGRGMSGGHCAYGLSKALYDSNADLDGEDNPGCVMYGQGADNRPSDFCVKCSPFVLAEPLERFV